MSDLEDSPSATVCYKNGQSSNAPHPEIHYYSKALEETGNPGLPTLNSLSLPFLTDERFPFWLSTGDRTPLFQHSRFRSCSMYGVKMQEPLLDIHSDAARQLQIDNGDIIALSTKYGKIHVRAKCK